MSTPNQRLAVLIDADNTSPKHAGALLEELASYGVASVKRAYGDWTTPQLNGWKSVLNQHAIVPVQQFAYTTGKNSTDSTLIIDAMDLLYSGNLDAFALVSSDSDFTRLATRLRESGMTVYGLGLRKTPASLVAACDRFIYLEVLGSESVPESEDPTSEEAPVPNLQSLLTKAINSASQEDGTVSVSGLGNYLRSVSTSFDPRLYGHSKLSALLQAQGYLTVTGSGSGMQVSLKKRAPAKKAAKKSAAKKQAD
ncbi:NYN domain-containing protein [Nocardioides bizhenqiangii]|uniref:NYN domain-containing protein n=1 Tax=Nocardioides bizhenqiangii TaxID=3095076 RepID=A0ABZ0ZSR3_9ACTN|nr:MULTISPECIES: NYN domain-containing protein [unclassified Nocardioides]MDZ5621947.1 NYN domain-containing protein [Nocardioides sp. HM23]WQQ27371.1 NYN domain-containing protein [Nocardioides sp. HM61]